MLNFFLTTFMPTLGVVLTATLLIYGVYYRWVDVPQKWLLTRQAVVALMAVTALCDLWLGVRAYLSHAEKQTWQNSAAVRASRERFVLPQDFQYGELLIPAGSLINRTDPFDRGEPHRPLALHGLDAVRFAKPVEVAGVLATALQVVPMRVELADNQRIGPVHRYDTVTQTWVPHKVMPTLQCSKGQIALFQVPHIPYDLQAELGKPPPDGANARFAPSQWLFRGCENGSVVVHPAYNAVEAAASTAP